MSWIPSYKKPAGGGGGLEIVEWSSGSDEQIVAMLEAHYNGDIDIHDYWAVGDERVVSLSAMSAMSPLTDAHAAQDVTFVLSNVGGKTLSDGTTCAFQVDQKDCLRIGGKMNSENTNAGGWKSAVRRTWCNEVYYNAIPSTLRSIFKQHINQTTSGNKSLNIVDTTDYFALRAEIEVLGYINGSYYGEGSQVDWYKTSSNIIKYRTTYTADWWTRSPWTSKTAQFCIINTYGNSDWGTNAITAYALAPFGVI